MACTSLVHGRDNVQHAVSLNATSIGRRMHAAGIDDDELREEASDLAVMQDGMVAGSFAVADERYLYQRAYNTSTGRRRKDDLIRRMKKARGTEPPET